MTCECNSNCTCSDTEIKQIVQDAVASQAQSFQDLTDKSEASQTAAAASEQNAANSATTAKGFSDTSSDNATAAASSAQQAAKAASAAATSASTAYDVTESLKGTAESLQTTANNLSDKVDDTNKNAEAVEAAVSTATSQANASAASAKQSAASASQSDSSATVATTQAAKASSSASSADTAATSAVTSANAAKASELSAAGSAATSASAVQSTATNAATASNASVSAGDSANAAQNSANIAASSATDAQKAATTALGLSETYQNGIVAYTSATAIQAAKPSSLQVAMDVTNHNLWYWNGTSWTNMNVTLDTWIANEGNLNIALNGDALSWTDTQGVSRMTWAAVEKASKEGGGVLGFATLSDLQAFTPTSANVLAMDTSTGNYYYWNGSTWVQSNSSATAVASKLAASAATGNSEIYIPADFTSTGKRWDAATKTQIADTDCMSLSIPVVKGACYKINNLAFANRYVENAVLLDASGAFVTLLSASHTTAQTQVDLNKFYNNTRSVDLVRGMFVAPQDGTVVFQYFASDYSGLSKGFSVEKISWKELSEIWTYHDNSKGVLAQLKNRVVSPTWDKISLSMTLATQQIGSDILTASDTDSRVTTRIAVKAGQYVQFSTNHYLGRASLFFTDTNDKFLFSTVGHADHVGMNMNVRANVHRACFDVLVTQDGYVRMETCTLGGSLPFIFVTDSPLNLDYDYALTGQALVPQVGTGIFSGDIGNAVPNLFTAPVKSFNSVYQNAEFDTDTRTKLGLKTVTAKPIILKKGQVLVYKGNFQIPILGVAIALNGCAFNTLDSTKLPATYGLISPTVFTLAHAQEVATNGWPATIWSAMSKGEAHVYADESDLLLQLMGYIDSNGNAAFGSVQVMSVSEYKKYRDQKYLPNLTFGGGATSESTYSTGNNETATNYFITFKDEIGKAVRSGTWWSSVRYNLPTLLETNQLWNGSVGISYGMSLAPTAATNYDKPVEGIGFCYHSAIEQSNASVCASSFLNYSTTDASGVVTRTQLNLSNLLALYPCKVYPRNAVTDRTGVKLPVYVSRYYQNSPQVAPMVFYSTNDTQTLFMPVVKGRFYHLRGNCAWNGSGIPTFYSTTTATAEEIVYGTSKKGVSQFTVGITKQATEAYYQAPSDGYICVPYVAALIGGLKGDSYDDAAWSDWQTWLCQEVTEAEYKANGVASDNSVITLPAAIGLRANILGFLPADTSKTYKTEVLIQFSLGDKVLALANAEIGISGTGTVSDRKKGYNIKLTKSNGKKLHLKVGDMATSNKWGLKAYWQEGTNTRDCGSNDLWKAIRQTRRKFVGKPSLRDSTSGAYKEFNYLTRPFTTTGFPIELYVGGSFYGVYTIRTRAEAPDYLMDDSKSTHVKIAPDYGLKNSAVNWGKFDFSAWDLLNPSLDDYTEGDATVSDATVQASITRFGDFFKGILSGSVTLTDDVVAQYLDRETAIDFFVFSQLIGNRDGIRNNVSMCSWDGKVWGFYPYDLDRTAGYDANNNAQPYNNNTIYQDDALNKLLAFLQPAITARYKELRTSGLFTAESLTEFYAKYADAMSMESYAKDASYWANNVREFQSIDYIYNWYQKRIDWMDGQWK